jgi:hypothetical protein
MRLGGHTLAVTLDPTQLHGVVPGVRGEASPKFLCGGKSLEGLVCRLSKRVFGERELKPSTPSK